MKEFTISVRRKLDDIIVEASITVDVPLPENEAAVNALKGRAQVDLRTLLRETYEQQKQPMTEQRNERNTGHAKAK